MGRAVTGQDASLTGVWVRTESCCRQTRSSRLAAVQQGLLSPLYFEGSRRYVKRPSLTARCAMNLQPIRKQTFEDIDFTAHKAEGYRSDIEFEQCIFLRCSWSGSKIDQCRFDRCQLIDCDLASAALTQVTFIDCQFARDDLSEATSFRFAAASASKVLQGNCSGVDFSHSVWHDCQFLDCRARALNAKGFSCRKTISPTVWVNAFTAERCDFSFSDFSDSQLSSSELIACNFQEVSFCAADLRDANLADCELDNIDWFNARLTGANLEDARFNSLDLRTMDLTGVRISRFQTEMLTNPLGLIIID